MKRRLLRGALLGAAVVLVLGLPAGSLYYEYNSGASCARCHEIRKNYDAWHASSHRNVECGECHGEITTLDPGFHLGNLRRLVKHVRQGFSDPVRLGTRDIPRLMEQCRGCHRQEFAQWESGAHSATYRRLFLDAKHNRQRLLTDDCLRCHGMHFEGGIRDLVAPVDANGPWRLLRPELADQPAIPCLSCHQVHREGELLPRAVRGDGESDAKSSAKQELLRPSVSLFDRREQKHFAVDLLPLPAMRDGARGGEDQSGYAAGAVLSMPRSAGQGGGGYGRRSHSGGRSRGVELSGVPFEARAADAGFVRHVPSAAVELRFGRGEDGHYVFEYDERAQYSFREVCGLPSEGDSEKENVRASLGLTG